MARLSITEGKGPSRRVQLCEGLRVGREDACDVVVEDAKVSRQHLRFAVGERGWTVIDLGSKHGTFVNGRKQPKASVAVLADGDQIQVGDTLLVFEGHEETSEVVREISAADGDSAAGADARLRMFYDLASAMDDFANTDALLCKLLDGIIEVLAAERGAVALCEPGRLRIVARGRGRAEARLEIAGSSREPLSLERALSSCKNRV